jgi:hypothetical protein
MTLQNESITFTPVGIWIQPVLSSGFWFTGNDVVTLLAILVAHPEMDIDTPCFRVRESINPYFPNQE